MPDRKSQPNAIISHEFLVSKPKKYFKYSASSLDVPVNSHLL